MMHAKVMTVDGVVANIGSANLNARSTAADEEVNVVVLEPELAQLLDDQFDEDLERSVRIEPGRWRRRSVRQRVAELAVAPIRRWS
jgi:cardiolipin synthase